MAKTVFITGASSGIGRATATMFAKDGWNVVATMRRPVDAGDLSERDSVLVARLDVQDQASITAAVETGIAQFGRIDALVNNAGYGQFGLFEATPPEKVRRQFDVNLFGVMEMTRALLPHFRTNRAGTIVNVSSGAGIWALPMTSLYCASKFALEGFSEALSYELAALNIGVKLVIPHGGITATSFGERLASDRAAGEELPDYDSFVQRTNEAFTRMTAASNRSSADVAAVIHEAVTDGGERLRYFIGDDARGFLKARREMTEEGYMAFMRGTFGAN